MALKHRLHPSLLLILAPLAVTAFAVYVTGWRWSGLAAGMSGKTQYWFLRSTPVPALLLGPLAGLLTVWPLPLHRRRPIAIASLLGFLVVAGFYALREYGRLAPFVERGIFAWDYGAFLSRRFRRGWIVSRLSDRCGVGPHLRRRRGSGQTRQGWGLRRRRLALDACGRKTFPAAMAKSSSASVIASTASSCTSFPSTRTIARRGDKAAGRRS